MEKSGFLLSVIIPAYNERQFIASTLDLVCRLPPLKEVVVVNDGSTDGTGKIIDEAVKKINQQPPVYLKKIEVIHRQKNEGKGAAVRAALPKVNGDVVLIQDADLELNPADYPRLLEPFETKKADVVFGSRFLNSQPNWGNKLLTSFSNLLSGLRLTDMETGYKVFRTEVLKSFSLAAKRFNIEPELAARTARAVRRQRLNFFEVPVSYQPRTYAQGKKIGWQDGIVALWSIFYFNIQERLRC